MSSDGLSFQFSTKSVFALVSVAAVMLFAFRQGSPVAFLLLATVTIATIFIAAKRAAAHPTRLEGSHVRLDCFRPVGSQGRSIGVRWR